MAKIKGGVSLIEIMKRILS